MVQHASIVDFAFRPGSAPRTFDEAAQADGEAYVRYYWAMLERGILVPPSKMEVMFLTASHTEEDIDFTIAAMKGALAL